MRIDLHMHSTVSDGTDAPMHLVQKLKEKKIELFSLTDHDDFLGCQVLQDYLVDDDIHFINGIELSCEYKNQKYHILGYGYDLEAKQLPELCASVHDQRMQKLTDRIENLKNQHGIVFEQEDIDSMYRLLNPGKPHLGNMLVKYGHASNLSEAINTYLNTYEPPIPNLTPEEAIETILSCGGIPVLAHGVYGDGRQKLSATELEERVIYLKNIGLQGIECYYSTYTQQQLEFTKAIAKKYDMYATAGSDYHGKNKTIELGYTQLVDSADDENVERFIQAVLK